MSFANKVVIVTGGSAGIGASTAVHFAREGAKVVIVGRREDKLKEVAEECKAFKADILIVKADITKESDIIRIVDETIKKYGKIDVLINNAGVLRRGCILDGQIMKTYDEVMNTNLRSVVLLTTLVAPHLIKTKGNIVNISSIAGNRVRSPEFTAYSLSKAALNMFSSGAAFELSSHGVRVNTVSPGPVRTEIVVTSGMNANIEDWKDSTALGRISDPAEVANLILFLASDNAIGITGSNNVTDNGCLIYRK